MLAIIKKEVDIDPLSSVAFGTKMVELSVTDRFAPAVWAVG